MSISPRASIYVNIFVAILASIVNGVVSFSGLVPDPANHAIIQWSALLLSLFSVVNAALHSVSSSSDGPLTNVRIKIEKLPPRDALAVFAVLALLLSFAGLELSLNAAMAKNVVVQHHKPAPGGLDIVSQHAVSEVYPTFAPVESAKNPFVDKPVAVSLVTVPAWDSVTPPVGFETGGAPLVRMAAKPMEASPQTGVLNDLWKKLQNVTLADLQYANNLAINNQDNVASTCYGALITLIQKNQSANIDPASGKPLDLPSVHLVSDFENLIIIYRELQPTSATSVACAPLMNAVKVGTVSALLSGFGTGSLLTSLVLP